MRLFLPFLFLFITLTACDSPKPTYTTKPTYTANQTAAHKVIVQEVLQVSGYSYIRGLEEGQENWIAAPTTAVEIGEAYYFLKSMQMKNFESKALNRTFESIYFVEKISKNEEDITKTLTKKPRVQKQETTKPTVEKKKVTIKGESNGISIAELFENKEKYNNTIVTLKGEVTKYNAAIMGVNWFHMQDGTDFNGEFDLTVTTGAEVKKGAIVTIQGKVALNKDFGAGYLYAIIIEEAVLVK